MKTSSQMGQDKSEIPKSSTSALMMGLVGNDLYSGLMQQSATNGMGGNGRMGSDSDSPSTQWLMNEAKSRLAETMHKLGLDSTKINGKHLATYAADDL